VIILDTLLIGGIKFVLGKLVAAVDATLAQAQREGGTALMGPMDIGVGHLAALQDPQGAVFALYAGRFDD